MSVFETRMAAGQSWESDLLARLHQRGWGAEPFGQALLSSEAHDALRRWKDNYGQPTLIRWLPDIITWRNGDLYLLDAKSDTTTTPNYAVENHALEAAEVFESRLHTPVLFVWRDGCMSPETVRNRHHQRKSGTGARGSGTSFVLIAKAWATPLATVFARPETSPAEWMP